MPEVLRERLPALLSLAIPTVAGIGFLATSGAPSHYAPINLMALVIAAGWIVFATAPTTRRGRRVLLAIVLLLLFAPLATGPEVNGVARWLPLGPVILNAGALLFPAIAVLAAHEDANAPPILLVALLAAMMQPDAALGFAIVFAAAGLHDLTKDWRVGFVCIIAFFASILMNLRGELPAVAHVERIFSDAVHSAPLLAFGLFLALCAGFAMLLFAARLPRKIRYTLAGAWFGLFIASLFSNYPTIFIGYGAAPILGFGLSLGLASGLSKSEPKSQSTGFQQS